MRQRENDRTKKRKTGDPPIQAEAEQTPKRPTKSAFRKEVLAQTINRTFFCRVIDYSKILRQGRCYRGKNMSMPFIGSSVTCVVANRIDYFETTGSARFFLFFTPFTPFGRNSQVHNFIYPFGSPKKAIILSLSKNLASKFYPQIGLTWLVFAYYILILSLRQGLFCPSFSRNSDYFVSILIF